MEEIIMNKKQYIIPVAEVVKIKSNQLLMTSTTRTMNVYSDDELENSGDILSRGYDFDE